MIVHTPLYLHQMKKTNERYSCASHIAMYICIYNTYKKIVKFHIFSQNFDNCKAFLAITISLHVKHSKQE